MWQESVFGIEPEHPVKGEIALWRAVIVQALMDAASQSNKQEMRYDKSQALCWLSGVSEDFRTVCDLAFFPPDYVRSRAEQSLARGCQWRKETAQGRR
jgi:hypothetical protein